MLPSTIPSSKQLQHVSTEARAFGNDNRAGFDSWTPNINPFKNPRWGRGHETPGEDPFHLQSYVNSLILELQGGYDPAIKKIVATCNHFDAYDLENWHESLRFSFDAVVSSQDLVEYYLPPFQQCARDSNVGAVMCSYNAVNSVPSCACECLLQIILREHWGWTNEHQLRNVTLSKTFICLIDILKRRSKLLQTP